jgi:chromate transporter
VNFSVVFGRQVGGTVGALVALLGLLGPPFVLVTLLGLLYANYGEIAALQRILAGVAAAAAGLTISTGIKMAGPLVQERPGFAHAVAIAAFVSVGILRWPIYWVLGVLIPCGIALAWWQHR